MTHLEELELLEEFAQNVDGDETTKLEKQIIAMEMSLGILKQSIQNDTEKHEKRKSSNGYIWKSARDMKSERNYAQHILDSHKRSQQQKKKKHKKHRKKSEQNLNKCMTDSATSGHTSTAQHASISVQADGTKQSQPIQHDPINDFFNASNDHKEEENSAHFRQAQRSEPEKSRKCCYHCYALFMPNAETVQEEDRFFCNAECLKTYRESIMITCCESDCNVKFSRENGYRFQGVWLCRTHFERLCVENSNEAHM
eukprot:CAMPEP_0197046532 /NCGR_PEP_ID=MMETSP1384-20130603/22240_1 /TAXON_ID=29189 /ORGANISM="Ammonia sp." /LENGTH=254 /DNA_ID=CAMNT_0042478349 /DNA_START=119 /DNA_END=883 /DNA_ORIENTATION=+